MGKYFFFFLFYRKVKRSKLERGDIDPFFFNIILLCGCVGSFYLFIYFFLVKQHTGPN